MNIATEPTTLLADLERAWRRSDSLFSLLHPEALSARPIGLRLPFVFYLGHLPAFAWNQICGGVLGKASLRPAFDDLFERGIDPSDQDGERLGRHTVRWPALEEILVYRNEVREAVRGSVDARVDREDHVLGGSRARGLHLVMEHELEHHETLIYMLQQLDGPLKRPPPDLPGPSFGSAASPRTIPIPAGRATLGADFARQPFGWDNEFPEHQVPVPAFQIDSTPVMNGDFFEFIDAGGYQDSSHWTAEAWAWRERAGLKHPLGWRLVGREWLYRGLFDDEPLTRVFDWPVCVSWAEAQAFLRWKGKRLPTEAEFHRAAYGTPDGGERAYPWGDETPGARHGSIDFNDWSPTPVGSHPDGASAFGVQELVGNGWEWTSTPFGPFDGFSAWAPTYPGYSADFFDSEHYVLLGGSWATDARLLRRSFRNWYRPNYPYVFTKFRGVALDD